MSSFEILTGFSIACFTFDYDVCKCSYHSHLKCVKPLGQAWAPTRGSSTNLLFFSFWSGLFTLIQAMVSFFAYHFFTLGRFFKFLFYNSLLTELITSIIKPKLMWENLEDISWLTFIFWSRFVQISIIKMFLVLFLPDYIRSLPPTWFIHHLFSLNKEKNKVLSKVALAFVINWSEYLLFIIA